MHLESNNQKINIYNWIISEDNGLVILAALFTTAFIIGVLSLLAIPISIGLLILQIIFEINTAWLIWKILGCGLIGLCVSVCWLILAYGAGKIIEEVNISKT